MIKKKNDLIKLGYDLVLLVKKIPYLFDMLGGPGPFSIFGSHYLDEFYFSMNPFEWWKNIRNTADIFLNIYLLNMNFALILLLTLTFSPLFFLVPILIPFYVPFFLYYIISSSVKKSSIANNYPQEKWFFINSTCVPSWWLRQNARRIEQLFGRPVTIIHNRTFGLLFDLLDCILSRSYNIPNDTVEVASRVLKETLVNSQIRKVVLLAHGKGGITAFLLAEQLLKDPVITNAQIAKLEIYTFGSAADEFWKELTAVRRISHIEHFANSHDYIAQIGVLKYKEINRGNYSGHLFEAYNKGHFFNQHYSHLLEKRAYRNSEGIHSRLYSYLTKQEKKKQMNMTPVMISG